MKVLIAEDNPMFSKLLAKMVNSCDFEAVAVADGRDAMRRLAGSEAPRIVFLDWEMPHIDGLEVCRRIKRAEHRPFTYVVMLTGRDEKKDMIKGLEAGADDYLTKPVEPAIVRSRLIAAKRIIEAIPPPEWSTPKVDGYDVKKVIGRGAFASVWDATHLESGRRIALKVLRVDLATEQVFNRFAREIEVARRMKHPSVASVCEAMIDRKLAYIAMDFIEGMTLDRLVRSGDSSPLQLIKIIATVCDGLHYAHRLGTIHRDLKPSNIMVDTSLQPKIVDFGLCKSLFDTTEANDPAESIDGFPIGTPLFMAPEQIRGRHSNVDPRADIYSLGVTLYMILLRRHPIVASDCDRSEAITALREGKVYPPTGVNGNFSKSLERILLKSLAVDPDDRYATAEDMGKDLRQFIADRERT